MFQHGHDVVLVARGAHREAIAARGLTVEWPEGSVTLPIPVVGRPAELTFGPDDVVDRRRQEPGHGRRRRGARRVRPAGDADRLPAERRRQRGRLPAPLRVGARRDRDGADVAPRARRRAGLHATRPSAILDVGRWPAGVDDVTEAVAAAFRAVRVRVGRPPRHRPLEVRQAAAQPRQPGRRAVPARRRRRRGCARWPRAEGEAVLDAAGIDHVSEARGPRAARRHPAHRPDRRTPRGRARRRGRAWRGASRSRSTTSTARSCCSAGCTASPTPVNELLQRGHPRGRGRRTRARLDPRRRPPQPAVTTLGLAVDSRTTSSTGNTTWRSTSAPLSSMRTAVAPFAACGWRTVVSGGVLVRAVEVSSKPTTDRSSGTRSPSWLAASIGGDGHLVAHREQTSWAVGSGQQLAHGGGREGAVVGDALDDGEPVRVEAGGGDGAAVAGHPAVVDGVGRPSACGTKAMTPSSVWPRSIRCRAAAAAPPSSSMPTEGSPARDSRRARRSGAGAPRRW